MSYETSRLFNAADGDRGVCKVDGLVRPDIVRGATGQNSFAIQIVRDSKGRPKIKNGEIVTREIRGNVQVRLIPRITLNVW